MFYAYLYLRENGTPYYAGKGKGKRVFLSLKNHYPPQERSRIIIMNCRNEEEALQTEKELIRNWGRKDIGTGCLNNLTDGGEGTSGHQLSLEARLRCGSLNKGKRRSPLTEFGGGKSPWNKGKKATIQACVNQSIAHIGKKHSEETKLKMQLSHIGKKHSEETKLKIRLSNLAK
jgi:hypothetical protein